MSVVLCDECYAMRFGHPLPASIGRNPCDECGGIHEDTYENEDEDEDDE